MCNYNGIRVSRSELIRLKEIELEVERDNLMRPVQSGFDYQDWPVIRLSKNGKYELVMMEWGFLPYYLKSREAVKKFRNGYKNEAGKWIPGFTTLNAVGEELLVPGKMYREAALKRRCLFVSSGFVEWQHTTEIGKSGKMLKTPGKYPYHIGVRDSPYFFIAGVWQNWTDKDTGETIPTAALITTFANGLMRQIHNSKLRMPAILTEDLAVEWISDGLTEERITEIATYQIPSKKMHAYPLHKDFMKSDDPLKETTYSHIPALVFEDAI